MKRASRGALFAAFLALATVAVALATFIQQRDQIAVTIIVNVTPAPRMAAYAPTATTDSHIRAAFSIDTKRTLRAGALSLNNLVAQNQQAVRVEASVQPNPLGTLLYSNLNSVSISATAGTTVVVPCAYTVTVDSTMATWYLKDGLYQDFSGTFPGKSLANNTYITTPQATATPFFVYADDGGVWYQVATNGLKKTYCVDLTLTIPVSVSGGTYSTNAVYTLYY